MKETFVANDKYTFINDNGNVEIRRYGEEWIPYFDGPGSNAILALVQEAIDLKAENDKLKKAIWHYIGCDRLCGGDEDCRDPKLHESDSVCTSDFLRALGIETPGRQ